MSNKKDKKKDDLKISGISWWVYQLASKIKVKFKYNIKFDRSEFKKRNKKEGCIVIYNHCCMDDHFISTAFFGHTHAHYVVTNRFNFFKKIRTVLKLAGAISRDQFKNDMTSIIKMKRAIERGEIISIAPAGQVSIHGGRPYIHPTIVKLLKMCKVDVYTLQIHGSYLANPKWGTSKRKYQISAKAIKSLSKEELKELDNDSCYAKIIDSLNIDDKETQKTLLKPIKGKDLSNGLENILYVCPSCGSKYSLETGNNLIKCNVCNNTVKYNKYGFLEGVGTKYVLMQDEEVWYNYQKHLLMKKIKEHNYRIEADVELFTNTLNELELVKSGEGHLVFDIDSLYYDGTLNGEKIHKDFNVSKIYQLPFAPGIRFNIPTEESFFEFVPTAKKQVIEWVQAIDALNELKNNGELNGD